MLESELTFRYAECVNAQLFIFPLIVALNTAQQWDFSKRQEVSPVFGEWSHQLSSKWAFEREIQSISIQ